MRSSLLIAVGLLSATQAEAGALTRATESLPQPPVPPLTQTTWVARSMRLNGLPMTVQAFRSRIAPDAFFAHFEGWSRRLGRVEHKRLHHEGGALLSIKAACCLISVQAQATAGGSEGTITVSRPLEGPARMRTRFPRPSSATLVNLQEYEDDGVESEHIAFTSARSVMAEAHAFAEHLARADWTLLKHGPAASTRGAQVIEAQKGAELAFVSILPDQSRSTATAIIVVWRKP